MKVEIKKQTIQPMQMYTVFLYILLWIVWEMKMPKEQLKKIFRKARIEVEFEE